MYQSAGTDGVLVADVVTGVDVTVDEPTAAHPFCSEAGTGVGVVLDETGTGDELDAFVRDRYATTSLPVDTMETTDQPSRAIASSRSGNLACSLA